MQAYDLLMLIVLGMATIFGVLKGFAWQVASLASVVVSYIVAYRFRFEVAEMIHAQPPWNQFLAMLILYVGTSFVIWVGFRLFSGMIDRVRLKEFDRHLGAAFGFAKGLIYCLLITMFAMSLLGPRQQEAICQSRSGYYISTALDRGVGVLPKEIHGVVAPYLASLDEKLSNHAGHSHDNPQTDGVPPADGPALGVDPQVWQDGLRRVIPNISLPGAEPSSLSPPAGAGGGAGPGATTSPSLSFPPLGSQPASPAGGNTGYAPPTGQQSWGNASGAQTPSLRPAGSNWGGAQPTRQATQPQSYVQPPY